MDQNTNKCFNCKRETSDGKQFNSGYLCNACKDKIKKIFELTAEGIGENITECSNGNKDCQCGGNCSIN